MVERSRYAGVFANVDDWAGLERTLKFHGKLLVHIFIDNLRVDPQSTTTITLDPARVNSRVPPAQAPIRVSPRLRPTTE